MAEGMGSLRYGEVDLQYIVEDRGLGEMSSEARGTLGRDDEIDKEHSGKEREGREKMTEHQKIGKQATHMKDVI